jgi:hypothetical protein
MGAFDQCALNGKSTGRRAARGLATGHQPVTERFDGVSPLTLDLLADQIVPGAETWAAVRRLT